MKMMKVMTMLMFQFTSSFVCSSSSSSSTTTTTTSHSNMMRLVSLENEDAMCNDDSRAGYYVLSEDSDSDSEEEEEDDDDVWLIHLQGGGWCWSEETCVIRKGVAPQLMTNASWSETYMFRDQSIFSFFRNRVFVPYCSSDGWIGNTDVDGNRFRGRTIVQSVFEQIHRNYNLENKTVVFSGCSAGGRGVMHNINFVREQVVEEYHAKRLIGLVDSGEYIDLELYNPNSTVAMGSRLRDQARGVLEYLNASISQECALTYPNAKEKCLMGETAFRTIRSPFIAHSFQFDSYQGSVDFGPTTPSIISSNASMSLYEVNFRARTRNVLLDLAKNRSVHEFAFHSSACWHHCNTESSTFSSGFTVNGTSLSDVVQNFLKNSSLGVRIMEDCEGIACGKDCY